MTELADSWHIGEAVDLHHTCSPHRVALVAEHIRSYYEDDTAAELMALLPDWTAWLTTRNATPAQLGDRCRPYAHGEPLTAIGTGPGGRVQLPRPDPRVERGTGISAGDR